MIVSAHYKEDLNWLKKSKYPVVICDKPGSDSSPFTSDKRCSLDMNRGREASSYLKYIIEYYDSLPDRVAFIHGHEEAYHQKYPKHILEAIKDARKDLDFVSLNNWIQFHTRNDREYIEPEVHKDSHERLTFFTDMFKEYDKHWEIIFKPILKIEKPEYIRMNASAQFIVSRRAIYRHSKNVYQKLLDYIMENDDVATFVLEYMWESLFTGVGTDMCLNMKECTDEEYRKSHFNI